MVLFFAAERTRPIAQYSRGPSYVVSMSKTCMQKCPTTWGAIVQRWPPPCWWRWRPFASRAPRGATSTEGCPVPTVHTRGPSTAAEKATRGTRPVRTQVFLPTQEAHPHRAHAPCPLALSEPRSPVAGTCNFPIVKIVLNCEQICSITEKHRLCRPPRKSRRGRSLLLLPVPWLVRHPRM